MINFDKNATTRTKKEVWDVMEQYALEDYGNPSALYPFAQKSRKAIEDAQEILASIINCQPNEIYFLSSGTQADNWVVNSFFEKSEIPCTFITSAIEHHAILYTFEEIERKGGNVIYLPVNMEGTIDSAEFERVIKTSPDLCSIMYVNNELGNMEPIDYIGHFCREYQVPFHTDAVQAFGKTRIDVDKQCIDFLSCSGHKFHAPRGIGFIYIREKYRDKMGSALIGGSQQRGMVAGTENVPGIVGLARAAQLAYENLDKNSAKIHELYWYFKSELKLRFPKITFNNHSSLENCLSVCFKEYEVKGEELLAFLGENDICASSGSACNSSSTEPSHVLKAIGLTEEEANSTIRFSFDEDNTKDEVDEVLTVLTVGIQMLGGNVDEISK